MTPTRLAFIVAFVLASGGAGSTATGQTTPPSDQAVARIGDRTITLAEVQAKWQEMDHASFMRFSQARYDALQQFVDAVIGDRLLEAEATARGISVTELLAEEMPDRITPVTDAEIETVYQQLGSQAQGTLEQMRDPIRQFLERQRPTNARAELIAELKEASELPITILLEPPRQEVAIATTDPRRGPAGAAVEIIEFSDFQ